MFKSFKRWWCGTPTELSMQEVYDLDGPYEDKLIRSKSSDFFRLLLRFWLHRWPILLPVIVGAAVAMFIHFDTKATSEPKQKENHEISTTNHNNHQRP